MQMKQLTKDYSPKHVSSSYSSMGRRPKRTFLQRRHLLVKKDSLKVSNDCKQTHFLGNDALVGEKSTSRSCLENLKAAEETVFSKRVLLPTKMPGSDLHIT